MKVIYKKSELLTFRAYQNHNEFHIIWYISVYHILVRNIIAEQIALNKTIT